MPERMKEFNNDGCRKLVPIYMDNVAEILACLTYFEVSGDTGV